ncbi:MAG TPA: hypothetical protein VJ951_15520 [Bacteroidales bacterium]|nr:hypothetical protein [Bacteroidales bacterium]
MSDYKENLEGVVTKLKEQGVQAGESEKKKIIENAQKEADKIIEDANTQSKSIIDNAKSQASQLEKNANAAISQAARDIIEATKTGMIDHLKSAFGKESESLFTKDEYLKVLLEKVLEQISGNKTVQVPTDLADKMENYLVNTAFDKEVVIKPLAGNEAKIVVSSEENAGIQFMVTAEDVREGLFSLLNTELVERITSNKEA